MKKHLCLVGCALSAIVIHDFGALAQTPMPGATAVPPAAMSAPSATTGQSPKKTEEKCRNQWRANQEAMMKRDMTEDSYVEQCSVADDAPASPLPKRNAAPSAEPK
ncbi:MAG TPA: hypothetical protein VJR30_02760 [Bradyrhizobium sp.]|nr:hypothetical protein [Bradyrhizobium sp.]